jgi:hypothetical protein
VSHHDHPMRPLLEYSILIALVATIAILGILIYPSNCFDFSCLP